jgi:hypothetical protein
MSGCCNGTAITSCDQFPLLLASARCDGPLGVELLGFHNRAVTAVDFVHDPGSQNDSGMEMQNRGSRHRRKRCADSNVLGK